MFLRYLTIICPDSFGHVGKQQNYKVKNYNNFKNYDVINGETNHYNIYCLISPKVKTMIIMIFGQLIEFNIFFLKNLTQKEEKITSPDPFLKIQN